MSSNVEGSYKRSATLGMAIGWGNLNGAVTSNVVSEYALNTRLLGLTVHHSIAPSISHGTDSDMALS